MDCYNTYKHPLRYQFKSLDGGVTASGGAYSGMTRTFDLVFPVQNTTQKYGNGYKGTFTYTSVTGNVVSFRSRRLCLFKFFKFRCSIGKEIL